MGRLGTFSSEASRLCRALPVVQTPSSIAFPIAGHDAAKTMNSSTTSANPNCAICARADAADLRALGGSDTSMWPEYYRASPPPFRAQKRRLRKIAQSPPVRPARQVRDDKGPQSLAFKSVCAQTIQCRPKGCALGKATVAKVFSGDSHCLFQTLLR